MTLTILKAEPFYPLGKPLPRPEEAKDVVDAVQIRPGIWRKPDGTMETRGYETPKPTTKPAEPEPVKAEVAALGDGWIAWGGGPCPIQDAGPEQYEIRFNDGEEYSPMISARCHDWKPEATEDHGYWIVAYRVLSKAAE